MCNFNLNALASPDIKEIRVKSELVASINALASALELNKVGELTITSGYRTPEHNKKVGGASRSYHMKGMAIDCYSDMPHNTLAEMALVWSNFTTAIVYKTHVHLDIREKGLGLRRNDG